MRHIVCTLLWIVLLTISWISQAAKPIITIPNADWMRSQWGVRVVLPAGDNEHVSRFDPAALVQQLATLRTPRWVSINATQGGYGGYFTTPNTTLSQFVHKSMVPQRDLLQETVRLLKNQGFRVIIYFAAEGPAGLQSDKDDENVPKHLQLLRAKTQVVRKSWDGFLKRNDLTNEDAISKYILEPIAVRFGSDIDGWWFDHGRWGDAEKYITAVRKGNPAALIAWNKEHEIMKYSETGASQTKKVWGLKRSNKFEDFTAGHITTTTDMAPWDEANEMVLKQVEQAATRGLSNIDGLLPHWLIPLQRDWGKGEADFPMGKVIGWTERMLKSGGAITWSVLLEQPVFTRSELGRQQYQQLKALDKYLLKERLVSPRTR